MSENDDTQTPVQYIAAYERQRSRAHDALQAAKGIAREAAAVRAQPSRSTTAAAVITELRLRSFAGGHDADPFLVAAADLLASLVAERDALRACLLLGLRVMAGLADPDRTDAWYAERDLFVERAGAQVGKGGDGA